MDLSVRNFAVVEIFGIEIWITETLRNAWIVSAVLIVIALIVRFKLTTYTDSPKGLQNVVELIVESFDRFVRNSAGERLAYLGHWFFTVFAFILFSNLSGIVMRPPTADWAVTFALAFATFILIQYAGIRYDPKGYVKGLTRPIFLFLPINIIGEFARPVSLSFRLFGNVLGGAILVGLLYNVAPVFTRFAVPIPLHIYFDIIMGILQTYIFTVLSLSFIGLMAGTTEQ